MVDWELSNEISDNDYADMQAEIAEKRKRISEIEAEK